MRQFVYQNIYNYMETCRFIAYKTEMFWVIISFRDLFPGFRSYRLPGTHRLWTTWWQILCLDSVVFTEPAFYLEVARPGMLGESCVSSLLGFCLCCVSCLFTMLEQVWDSSLLKFEHKDGWFATDRLGTTLTLRYLIKIGTLYKY